MQQLNLIPVNTDPLSAERMRLQRQRIALNTEAMYAYDWRLFATWCDQANRHKLPASTETLCLYATNLLVKGKKISTVTRYLRGILHHHQTQGYTLPAMEPVRDILWNAQQIRCEQPRQMRPISTIDLRRLVEMFAGQETAIASRNRALLIVGFASALRSANLSDLDLADLDFCGAGVKIKIHREKQDRQRRGRIIGLPTGKDELTCPVRSLAAWLTHRGRDDGPLFTRFDRNITTPLQRLSPKAIRELVKQAVRKIGLDSAEYGAHSLRAGFITEAGLANVSHLVIAAHTGHRSLQTLQRYFRPIDVFRTNPVTALNL